MRLSGLIPFVSNEIQTEPKKRTKKDRNVTFDMERFLAGIMKKTAQSRPCWHFDN